MEENDNVVNERLEEIFRECNINPTPMDSLFRLIIWFFGLSEEERLSKRYVASSTACANRRFPPKNDPPEELDEFPLFLMDVQELACFVILGMIWKHREEKKDGELPEIIVTSIDNLRETRTEETISIEYLKDPPEEEPAEESAEEPEEEPNKFWIRRLYDQNNNVGGWEITYGPKKEEQLCRKDDHLGCIFCSSYYSSVASERITPPVIKSYTCNDIPQLLLALDIHRNKSLLMIEEAKFDIIFAMHFSQKVPSIPKEYEEIITKQAMSNFGVDCLTFLQRKLDEYELFNYTAPVERRFGEGRKTLIRLLQ